MPPSTAATNAFKTQHGTHGGGDRRILGDIHQRGDSGQARANGKREGNGAVDMDAHQGSGILIFRNSAHGLPAFCILDKQEQAHHHRHTDENG